MTTAPSPALVTPAPATPAAIWASLLRVLESKASMSWVRSLELLRIEGNRATIAPRPGQSHLRNFLTPARLEQLGQLLGPVAGRPLRVELQSGAAPASETGPDARPPVPAAAALPMNQQQRQEALRLPLVQQVQRLFDATLVDVRPEQAPPVAGPGYTPDDPHDDEDAQNQEPN